MDNKATLSALVIGIIFGCASSQATEIATANAEQAPTAAPAAAPGALRECAVLWLNSDDDLDDMDNEAKSIAGWTPIGGAGDNGVVLCR